MFIFVFLQSNGVINLCVCAWARVCACARGRVCVCVCVGAQFSFMGFV